MSLCHAIADIGGKVAGGFTAGLGDSGNCLIYKFQKVRTAGMTVAEGALHHNLRFGQIFYGPTHSHAQRVLFRGQCSNFLTDHFTCSSQSDWKVPVYKK